MYRPKSEKPKNGQLCLCKCYDWCSIGFQVAVYNGKFDYPDSPNDELDRCVTEWLPLDEDGEPE